MRKKKSVKVRLTPEEYEEWKKFAEYRNETLASTIRVAMRLFMKGLLYTTCYPATSINVA